MLLQEHLSLAKKENGAYSLLLACFSALQQCLNIHAEILPKSTWLGFFKLFLKIYLIIYSHILQLEQARTQYFCLRTSPGWRARAELRAQLASSLFQDAAINSHSEKIAKMSKLQ